MSDASRKGRMKWPEESKPMRREASRVRWQQPGQREMAAEILAARETPMRGPVGRRHTDEERQKISEARRRQPGHPQSAEAREKVRQAKLGKPRPESVRLAVSAAAKARAQPHGPDGRFV